MADKDLKDAVAGLESGPEATPAGEGAPRGASAEHGAHPSVQALRARFGEAVRHHTVMAGDEHVVYLAPERTAELLRWLKEDATQQYDLLKDVTAVDYGPGRPLELVYELWSIPNRRQLRVKTVLPLDALEIDSVEPIWRTADWLEREVYDLFGIHFRGHPDLRRIMMPENYAEGHPLRKDFPLRGRFSRAEQTRRAMSIPVEANYTPQELAVMEEPEPIAPTGGGARTHAEASGALNTDATPPRPNDPEHHSLGTSGSAAGGTQGAQQG